MKAAIPTPSRGQRIGVTRRSGVLALTKAGFAPVQFTVCLRRMPVAGSGLRCSSAKAPVRAGCSGRMLISTRHSCVFRFHEDARAAADEPTPAPHSRFVALQGPEARGAAVPRRVRQAPIDGEGVASRGERPRAQARKRRIVSDEASYFTEPRMGSRPMAGHGGSGHIGSVKGKPCRSL